MTGKKLIKFFKNNTWGDFLYNLNLSAEFRTDQKYHDIAIDTFDLKDVQVSIDHGFILIITGLNSNRVEDSCAFCEESYYYLISKNNDSPFFRMLCDLKDV